MLIDVLIPGAPLSSLYLDLEYRRNFVVGVFEKSLLLAFFLLLKPFSMFYDTSRVVNMLTA
jgi:hypothetical protein